MGVKDRSPTQISKLGGENEKHKIAVFFAVVTCV